MSSRAKECESVIQNMYMYCAPDVEYILKNDIILLCSIFYTVWSYVSSQKWYSVYMCLHTSAHKCGETT